LKCRVSHLVIPPYSRLTWQGEEYTNDSS
jgi:hypothetical protein